MKCATCPVTGDATCRAEVSPRACDLANPGHPEFQPAYRELMAKLAGDRPGVAESASLVKAMNACPSRTRDADCGCSGGRCAERGGAIVTHIDCFACLGSRRDGRE